MHMTHWRCRSPCQKYMQCLRGSTAVTECATLCTDAHPSPLVPNSFMPNHREQQGTHGLKMRSALQSTCTICLTVKEACHAKPEDKLRSVPAGASIHHAGRMSRHSTPTVLQITPLTDSVYHAPHQRIFRFIWRKEKYTLLFVRSCARRAAPGA